MIELHKSVSFSVGICLLAALSSCGVFDGNKLTQDNIKETEELNYNEINQYVNEWKDAKPGLQRLTELENDLALIIKEVSKSSTLKNLPQQYSDKQITDLVQAEYGNMEASSQPVLIEDGKERQYFAAQLALFLREDSARVGWTRLLNKYPNILSGLTPLVEKSVGQHQSLYSLRVGPFTKEETAALLCSIFNQYKFKCRTTPFAGYQI